MEGVEVKASQRKLVYQALVALVVAGVALGIVDAGALERAVDVAQRIVAAAAALLALANLTPDE